MAKKIDLKGKSFLTLKDFSKEKTVTSVESYLENLMEENL